MISTLRRCAVFQQQTWLHQVRSGWEILPHHEDHELTNIDAPRRTDASFRSKTDESHHFFDSPLLQLPIDMVESFPVGDELHLMHVGVMKKLQLGWMEGTFGTRTELSAAESKEISIYLEKCTLPSEIHRKMRTLVEIRRWKATEFRSYLLYVNVVVLKRYLRPKFYEHFLLFYCANVIFSSDYHVNTLLDIADNMLKHFVYIFKSLYGCEYVKSNMHNLIHVAEEVRKFGTFKIFSTYKFENKFQSIKKLVRSGNYQLKQVANRLFECESALSHETVDNSDEKAASPCRFPLLIGPIYFRICPRVTHHTKPYNLLNSS